MKPLKIEVSRPECNASATMVSARVTVDRDLSELLPYLNATQEKARYYAKGPFLRFACQGLVVVVEKDQVRVCCFEDTDQARTGAQAVIARLAEVEAEKDRITPDATPYDPPAILEIYRLLPRQSACGKCGHPSCLAFAAALVKEEADLDACVPLQGQEAAGRELRKKLPGN